MVNTLTSTGLQKLPTTCTNWALTHSSSGTAKSSPNPSLAKYCQRTEDCGTSRAIEAGSALEFLPTLQLSCGVESQAQEMTPWRRGNRLAHTDSATTAIGADT